MKRRYVVVIDLVYSGRGVEEEDIVELLDEGIEGLSPLYLTDGRDEEVEADLNVARIVDAADLTKEARRELAP
jgi:hypothetical protein